jgi:hypothetical protein
MNAKGLGPQGLGTSKNKGYTIGEGGNKGCGCKGICQCSKSPMKQTVKDACYKKVKATYDVFPSAYASGAIAKCRKNK